MNPAGTFFESRDLPRLNPGRPSGSVRLENDNHATFTTNFELFRRVQKKDKWLEFVTEDSDLAEN